MSKALKINGKWPLILPDNSADEWLDNMKWHNNTWEMPRLLALEKLIKGVKDRQPVVLYIGAYKGDMPALLASWGARIILVEATAGFWPLIKETWELNDLEVPMGMFSGLISRDTTTNVNLTEWPERSEPFVDGQTGFAHLAESGGHFPEMSIDDICSTLEITPDIVTMDIEGSELLALQGGIKTIENNNLDLMVSVHPEFGYHNHGYYERELHDFLRDRKYVGTWLDYDHEHHWWYHRK